MAQWSEHAHILASSSSLGIPISSLSFDPYSDLLHSGTSLGHLSSHYGPDLARYTSSLAQGARGRPESVRGILADERAVYTVGDMGVRAANRRGVARWTTSTAMTHPHIALSGLTFSPLTSSSDLIACGAPRQGLTDDECLLIFNANVGGIVRKASSDAPLLHVRRTSRYVACGTKTGHIQLRDPRSLNVERRLHAHPGGLIDMQADGNLVWSAGWTVRLGHPVPEPHVKVHDVRAMRPLVPIPFSAPGGPALLAIHPKLSTTIVVASPGGQLQVVDVGNPGEGQFFQVNTPSYLTSMAISPSADFLAFGEADGSIRLWSATPEPQSAGLRFTPFNASAPEAPDVPELPAPVNWSTDTPLSSIGLPYFSDPLLSLIPYDNYATDASPLFNPPRKVDPVVLSTMRTVDGVSYAPLPRHMRGKRNMIRGAGPGGASAGSALKAAGVGGSRRPEERRRIGIPLFRSEREKEAAKRAANGGEEEPLSATGEAIMSPGATGATMPSYYGVKTIQYSKFGIEDFDFGFYNRTPYSGLETHIQNSYANAHLQALHYLVPLRRIAQAHILDAASGSCSRENCLLCEAGFLFRMLETAKGANCQATNFLRALGTSERAASLGLMDKEDSPTADTAYSNLIQTFNRFVLDTMSLEALFPSAAGGRPIDPATNPISKLFGHAVKTRTSCATCGAETERDSSSHVVDLIYPRKPLSNEPTPPSDFASILRASLVRETITKSLCRSCGTANSLMRSRRELPQSDALPQALSINASVHTAEQLAFWIDGVGPGAPPSNAASKSRRTFLPPKLALSVKGDEVRSLGLWTPEDEAQALEGAAIYAVRSVVVQIQADKDVPHLCAVVRVPSEEEEEQKWMLFNDFLVREVPQEEALGFPGIWKIPAVLFLERIDRQALEISALPTQPDTSILCKDTSIAWNRDASKIRHTVLSPDELPKPGTLVAIDAEFVALSMEELEVRSDGTRSVIRPSRFSLARVSVIRGEGEKEGTPFIDEHIHTCEPVVDYLTQFSGILPGDLDPETSKYTLVPLKVAYKKLRLLVDLGCIFIGHGLKKDFRIINIHVPEAQVIDTVDLYHSAAHPRKLSLRFLSWFLLKQDIQTGSALEGHDSIEDAHAALRLYRLYEGFEKDGRLDDVMEDLYEEGRRVNWRPPAAATATAMDAEAAALASQAAWPGSSV